MTRWAVVLSWAVCTFRESSGHRSVLLNNTNVGASGIGVNIYGDHVQIVNDSWCLDPISQEAVDIELHMNFEWGFHPFSPSSVTMTLNGKSAGGELMALFGVANGQYFSVATNLGDGEWKMYPDPMWSGLAVSDDIFTDIITEPVGSRSTRISNHEQWTELQSTESLRATERWPLTLSITNDPQRDTVYFECIRPEGVLSTEWRGAFATNQGLSVYFMNNRSDGRPFTISSIEVGYDSMTYSPTPSPTVRPSPTLSVIKPPTGWDQEVDSNLSTTALGTAPDRDRSDTPTVSTSLYLLVIAILSVLLCIVTTVLIAIVARTRGAAKRRRDGAARSESTISIADQDGLRIVRELDSTDTEHDSLYGSGLRSPSKMTQRRPFTVSAQISPFKVRTLTVIAQENDLEGGIGGLAEVYVGSM